MMYDCVVQLLFVFGCLPSETSDSLLVFALYIGNPQLTNGNVLNADDVIGSISVSLSLGSIVRSGLSGKPCVYNAISQLNSCGACGRRK